MTDGRGVWSRGHKLTKRGCGVEWWFSARLTGVFGYVEAQNGHEFSHFQLAIPLRGGRLRCVMKKLLLTCLTGAVLRLPVGAQAQPPHGPRWPRCHLCITGLWGYMVEPVLLGSIRIL